MENHMFKTIGPVPKQCTTLERVPYLDRPDLKFICKMKKAGVFTAAMPCFSLKNSSCFFISSQLVLDLHYGEELMVTVRHHFASTQSIFYGLNWGL